jgi:hypothetical protein
MLRFHLLISILFFSLFSFAQNDTIHVLGPSIGIFEFNSSALNDDLASIGAAGKFQSVYTATGIDFVTTIPEGGRYGSHLLQSAFSFGYILPQTVNCGDISISKYTLHGWQFASSFWGFTVVDNHGFVLAAGPGLEFGNLKLEMQNESDKIKATNSFFSPFARLDLRVNFGHFGAGLRASYRYDITNPKWINEVNTRPLPDFRNYGYGFQFYIGYSWKRK